MNRFIQRYLTPYRKCFHLSNHSAHFKKVDGMNQNR